MASAERILIEADPFHKRDADRSWLTRGIWPFHWIGMPGGIAKPVVLAFRCRFTLDAPARVRIHVTADETYELFLNGQRIGRGPERGTPTAWRYDTYDLTLPATEGTPHVLAARVAALGPAGLRAQMSLGHGFLLAPEEPDWVSRIGTGTACWEVRPLPGYAFAPPFPHDYYSIGHNVMLDGALIPPGCADDSPDWTAAVPLHPGSDAAERTRYAPIVHLLRPAALPPRIEATWPRLHVRMVTPFADEAYRVADDLPGERADWERMLQGGGAVTLLPGTGRRVLIDLEDYVCAHTALTLRGNGSVRVQWAESLFEQPEAVDKGDRSAVEGKHFTGVGDTFCAGGGDNARTLETLLWRAGRYVEVVAEAGAEPLVIERFTLTETRFPLGPMQATFASDDPELDALLPRCWRTLQCCSHDTLTDGPYYEQMMWLGDAVQQAAALLAGSDEADPLLRQTLLLFDQSRLTNGLTRARYPARDTLVIATFSLHMVGLAHQHALWRGDPELLRTLLPGLRGVLDYAWSRRGADGVMQAAPGWNFLDWANWPGGIPPGGDRDATATLNFLLVKALREHAALEAWLDEPEMAARSARRAATLAEHTSAVFWDEARGAFADDRGHQHFSEHAQVLAALSGALDGPDAAERRARVRTSLLQDNSPSLTRVTLAFAHYLFESCRALDLGGLLYERLRSDWFSLPTRGLLTTPERPEPSRSDCHGWSAHPLFHTQATLLGIRPADFGFAEVEIAPLATVHLRHLRGSVPHPSGGQIAADLRFGEDGSLEAHLFLPPGVTGRLHWGGTVVPLQPGDQRVILPF